MSTVKAPSTVTDPSIIADVFDAVAAERPAKPASAAPSLDLVYTQLKEFVAQTAAEFSAKVAEHGGYAQGWEDLYERREIRENLEHNLRLFEDLLDNFCKGQSELGYHSAAESSQFIGGHSGAVMHDAKVQGRPAPVEPPFVEPPKPSHPVEIRREPTF
jgi:hypothetical protein